MNVKQAGNTLLQAAQECWLGASIPWQAGSRAHLTIVLRTLNATSSPSRRLVTAKSLLAAAAASPAAGCSGVWLVGGSGCEAALAAAAATAGAAAGVTAPPPPHAAGTAWSFVVAVGCDMEGTVAPLPLVWVPAGPEGEAMLLDV